MAGLLGEGWEDPQSQMIMGLAQGLLSARGGAGFAAGLGNMQQVQQNQSKKKLMDMQLANYQSEIDARKLAGIKDARQQSMIESMFGGGGGGAQGASYGSDASPAPQGNSAATLVETARKYGIPDQAIHADMVFNGGKGIAAMLEKHGARDMQVTNGYAYDKNSVGAGFMPSLSTSTNGQTSMTRIGPDGMPVVSAPAGALETFGAYKGMETGLGAAAKVNLRKNADGTESPVSELTENPTLQGLLGGRPLGAPALPTSATAPGSWRRANPNANIMAPRPGESDKALILTDALKTAQQQLASAQTPAEQARAQSDIAGIASELQKIGISPSSSATMPSSTATGVPAYGISTEQAMANDAKKETIVGTAKADVQATQAKQAGADSAINAYRLIDKALAHPGLETATGLSGSLDPRNYIPGTNAKNFDSVAKQLQGNAFLSAFASLKGAGQITEVEGAKATAAIARLQQAQSTPEYKSALKDYQDVIKQGLKRMGVDPEKLGGGATGEWGDKKEPAKTTQSFDAKPPAHQFKGKIATAPDGKRYQSDGMIWKEVK